MFFLMFVIFGAQLFVSCFIHIKLRDYCNCLLGNYVNRDVVL